ncbi:tRNA (5-methylaminomethyl-2-thiouridylate)-methyltransferase [Frankineae bacterium MT45]|nr:tRNA (5-methylaminomethyl-2-thiouridylate)-methyltransferase [Frankineae bacterium MT45]
MKVLAAMSGGVDSAVAAARAVDAGHDVTGVHLALAAEPATLRHGARGCCTVEDSNDARRAADVLGIPFYIWDLAERFRAEVIDDFVAEYAAGRTPNPCLRCNEKIKFTAVLDRAIALGFDAVVTGHHAKLEDGALRRSVDMAKDQSYVLAVLTPHQLAHAIFPLGDSTKEQVRAEAAARGLAVADKPDSHDICFIADGDTRAFLAGRLGAEPGPIVEAVTGAVLGSHQGSFGFTVGQRRGLSLGRPDPSGEPRYVLSIQPKSNSVVVGPASMLDFHEVQAERPIWTRDAPAVGSFECLVQMRAHGAVVAATVTRSADDELSARLHEPQRGVAAGQALVMYDADTVIGSATISGTTSVATSNASAASSTVPASTVPTSIEAQTDASVTPVTASR